MKQTQTYRQKFKLLLIGIGALLLISYVFAFRKTLHVRSEYKTLQQKLRNIKDAPAKLARTKQKLEAFNNFFTTVDSAKITHEQVLQIFSSYCTKHKLIIHAFPEVHKVKSSEYFIETYRITIQGGFNELLKLLYYIEMEKQIGNIVSTRFFIEEQRSKRIKKLYMELYIQYITSE